MKVMLDEKAFLPLKAHADDAGYDLFTPIDFKIEGNKVAELHRLGMPYSLQSAMVDTGVHIAIPSGYVGMIKSRSSLNKRGLVAEGVIDSGYIGSIVVKLVNLSQYETHFKRGDKIAQLVIMPISTEALELVDRLDDTERGSNGFGSTGR
jgi:dUTP pyrophosphatase